MSTQPGMTGQQTAMSLVQETLESKLICSKRVPSQPKSSSTPNWRSMSNQSGMTTGMAAATGKRHASSASAPCISSAESWTTLTKTTMTKISVTKAASGMRNAK